MRRLLASTSLIILANIANAYALPAAVSNNVKLTFSDEFNSGKFDDKVWNRSYPYNKETGAYANFTPDSFEMTPTGIRLRADKRDFAGKPYTAAGMTTFGSFSQRYGYYEIRARMPAGKGVWPAFWLLTTNQAWPPEIDVFEYLGGSPTSMFTTVHWLQNGTKHMQQGKENKSAIKYAEGFHTFGIAWKPDSLVWYIDDQEVHRYTGVGVTQEPMYLLVNLALGNGGWSSTPDPTTTYPQYYDVDYVRAYQFHQYAGDVFTPPAGARGYDYVFNKPQVSSLFVKPGDKITITSSGTARIDLPATQYKVSIRNFLGDVTYTTFNHPIKPTKGSTQTFTDTYTFPADLPDGVYTIGLNAYFGATATNPVANAYLGAAANVTVSRTPVKTTALEPLVTEPVALDFQSLKPTGVKDQVSKKAVTAFADKGTSISLTGNNWQAVDVTYNVTAKTMLEADVTVSGPSEIIGLGLQPKLDATATGVKNSVFRLAGEENWQGIGNYVLNGKTDPFTAHIKIPVGKHYTGAMKTLLLVHDDDQERSGNVVFGKVKIYEAP